MTQANQAIQLYGILWRDIMIISVVEPIATSGAELWKMNKRSKTRIMAMEMNYWKRCLLLFRKHSSGNNMYEKIAAKIHEVKMGQHPKPMWWSRNIEALVKEKKQ